MKKNLLIIFGGKSTEHDVSCKSVITVESGVDKEKYNVILVGITKDGRWVLVKDNQDIRNNEWVNGLNEVILSTNPMNKVIYILNGIEYKVVNIDVIFPVMHGKYGEDGCIQGIFELSNIPYVGSSVLASSISMDKAITKIIVEKLNILQAKYLIFNKYNDINEIIIQVIKELGFPVFVKPANSGSSQGVSKAFDQNSLKAAINLALQNDVKILIEETVVGRELECAVISSGNGIQISGIGEIKSKSGFYDYEEKYNSDVAEVIVEADISIGQSTSIKGAVEKIFRAVGAYSLSRVDFFLKDNGEVIFNEINTLPGFTSISMYPKLWEKQGISIKKLVELLIESAFSR